MFVYSPALPYKTFSCLLLIVLAGIRDKQVTASLSMMSGHELDRQAEEYIMTSAVIDGIKRSNVCADGYRIHGALLKSYPYSTSETYLPYEDCHMTFKARRQDNLIRVRIIKMDINDIQGGVNCMDSLRFYKSPYLQQGERLNSVECGQVSEAQNFTFVSTTGVVTAHFHTDGGNVHGLGFKVVLTSFRYPTKIHPCDPDDDEFLCHNGECISSALLCDGVAHCTDGSDEFVNRTCNLYPVETTARVNVVSENNSLIIKSHQWRGILIIAFFLLIFVVFALFMMYFFCRRCCVSGQTSTGHTKKHYSTIVNSPLTGRTTLPTTRVITQTSKHLQENYNLL